MKTTARSRITGFVLWAIFSLLFVPAASAEEFFGQRGVIGAIYHSEEPCDEGLLTWEKIPVMRRVIL